MSVDHQSVSRAHSASASGRGTSARSRPPIEDQLERFLVLLFLRRYITWCARTRRFAAMEGAARLIRDMR
jgi:hypothetical protein